MARHLLCSLMLMIAIPLAAQAEAPDTCLIMVSVVWPEHDLSGAQVRVFRDERRRDLVEAFPATDASGRVVVAVPPGTYYVTALADLNKNDKLDAGDGLGFYGVVDPNTDRPQALEVKTKLSALGLVISLQMQADGKLVPTGAKPPPLESPPAMKWCQVSGMVSGGTGQRQVVYLVARDGRASYAALPGGRGAFSVSVPAGEYYVFAVEDSSGNEGAGPGDLFAVDGYKTEMGRDFPTVKIAGDVADVRLQLQWRVSETGLLRSLAGATEGPQVALETLPAVVIGTVAGAPEGAKAVVSAAVDARFVGEVGSVSTGDGRFVLALAAGVYYLNVMSLQNPDGRTRGPGDLVGFLGVSDLRKAHGPQPVALRAGEMRTVQITFVARLDEQLRPAPLE